MKHKLLPRTIAICAAGSLMAGSLMAAPGDPGSAASPSDPSSPGAASSSQSTSSSSLAPSPTSRMGPARASQLMSATVKDQQGNTVGQINDFVISPRTGRIVFAIVSLSDQGGKLTAVPWMLIRPGGEPNTCTLNTTKEKLDSSQTFDASSWPDFSQPSTSMQIFTFYGVRPGRFGGGSNQGEENEPGGTSSGQPESGSPGSQSPGTPGTPGTPPQQ